MNTKPFDCQSGKLGRRIALALLAGTMLATLLVSATEAKESDMTRALAAHRPIGSTNVTAEARPAVTSVMVQKSRKFDAGNRRRIMPRPAQNGAIGPE